MYEWRKMTAEERAQTLRDRILRRRPWHSPPHRYVEGVRRYSISAACYEHQPVIAHSAERFDELASRLMAVCEEHGCNVFAWCILPNHYHMVLRIKDLRVFLHSLKLLHGRTSYEWNGEENRRGRRVWCNYIDRQMRSEAHFQATVNYVLHNPVKHGYVERWQDWPWSNATEYLAQHTRQLVEAQWHEFHPDKYEEIINLPF